MDPVIFVFAGLLVIVVLVWLNVRGARDNALSQIRAQWGNTKKDPPNLELIARYTFLIKETHFHRLSNQTLQDIDFDQVFGFLDRTTSRVGQQYLFHMFRHPKQSVSALQNFDEEVRFYLSNVSSREQIQQQLYRLSNVDAYHICSLFREELIARPSWYYLPLISVCAIVILAVSALANPFMLICVPVPIAVNMVIHFYNKGNAFQFVKSLSQLGLLIEVASKLNEITPSKRVDVMPAVRKFFLLKRKLRMIDLSSDTGVGGEFNQVGNYFTELIKATFLIEFYVFFQLMKELEDKRDDVHTLFKFVGETDAAISVASLRSGRKIMCTPVLSEDSAVLDGKALYHPIIPNCVVNDLGAGGKGVLITGSNMAGKTTFLRNVMINSILAQTIYCCFAESFHSPIVKQFSTIRIDDNVLEGKSYYFEEVNTMKKLIEESALGYRCLFVLDEVFKGTNTIERIAAAKAILEYFVRNGNFVLVSTHDVELVSLLDDTYEQYHFTETIEDGELNFDHKLKSGPLKTRNAIRILKLSGYPDTIIQEAQYVSSLLSLKSVISSDDQKTH